MNRLPLLQRVMVYATFAVLLATGVLWEGLSPGPWAALLMKVHGGGAMLALVLFGTLVVRHIPSGWGSLKNRWSGVLLVSAMAWLIASGYLLYYAGSEPLRLFASQSHLWVGVAAGLVVTLHMRRTAIP